MESNDYFFIASLLLTIVFGVGLIAALVKKARLDCIVADLSRVNKNLEGELCSANTVIANGKTENNNLKYRIKDLTEKVSVLEEKNFKMEIEREELQSELEDYQTALQTSKELYEKALFTNEELKTEILSLNRRASDMAASSSDTEQELARFKAEASALLKERNEIQDLFDRQGRQLEDVLAELGAFRQRCVTVHRDMPADLVSSRKAEKLSVLLRKYITCDETGASLTVLLPPFPDNPETPAEV